MIAYPTAGFGDVVGGCAIDGVVGRADLVGIGGFVADVVVVAGLVDVVVPGVVATSGDVEVVELAAIVVLAEAVVDLVVVPLAAVVVVPAGAVVVVVDSVAIGTLVEGRVAVGTVVAGRVVVSVLGSAVTVTVDVSTEVVGAVDIGGETTAPGSGTPGKIWIERLAVAEKLAPADAAVEVSAVVAVVDSVAVAWPAPGSGGSTAGGAIPESTVVSALPVPSPGAESSPDASDIVLAFTAPASLGTAPQSRVCTVGSPGCACASFTCAGGPESARTTSVIPIAVVTNAVTTPAREICRRNRPPDRGIRRRGSSSISVAVTRCSLLSTVRIRPPLSSL
ncbi:hypothetical protein IU471_16825 [Nocardia elegans]|uniref:hypothetical protein n=1 Tax=Nocardia elegans TaxID=300029 RepID=UPI0018933A8F|nr:hypothetical protein [Nocardia elegans]MBF6245227.1 hypothetical protein [Nocardia elegans]